MMSRQIDFTSHGLLESRKGYWGGGVIMDDNFRETSLFDIHKATFHPY